MVLRKREFLPWYRKPGYRGRMSEEEKRHLDAIRDRHPHPAATGESLPEEAQSYINELELEVYDSRQGALLARTLLLFGIGVVITDANFLHLVDVTGQWPAFVGVVLLVAPWPVYLWQWRKNSRGFLPSSDDPDWHNPTDERLREAWELNYISSRARRTRAD